MESEEIFKIDLINHFDFMKLKKNRFDLNCDHA